MMHPRRHLPVLVALVCALTLPACREPDSLELFVRQDRARSGVYEYSIPLTDTTAAYDFWFYSRTMREPLESLRLDVTWCAPSGDAFSETVYMRAVEPKGSKELYRSGMVPAQAGDWQLRVRPVGTGEDFVGLGVIVRKQDGTR